MPERPDLRQIASSIREALADYDREALIDILTYVFKEYVVEGPPPLLVNQAERITDLEGLSFPELMTALQTRLDLPELSLFDVDGDQVSVRVGGVRTPLSGPGVQAATDRPAMRAERPAPQTRDGAPPAPGVRIVETELSRRPPVPGAGRPSVDEAIARGRGDLAGMEQRRGVAPRPTGLAISGRPAGAMSPPAGATGQPPAEEAKQEDEKGQRPGEKPVGDGDDDDASIRFSLLELD